MTRIQNTISVSTREKKKSYQCDTILIKKNKVKTTWHYFSRPN